MDTIEKDLSNRTRTIMMDALRESFGDTPLLDLSNENLDSISSSSMNSVPLEESSLKSKEANIVNGPNDLDGIFFGIAELPSAISNATPSSSITNGSTKSSSVPVDELICFSDPESSPGPALPEKQLQHKPVSSVFNDEPLIDLEINEQHPPNSSRNTSTSSDKMNRQMSTNSMLGGVGGINDILKNVAMPSPTVVKNNEFHTPWSPVEKEENPWASEPVNEEEDEEEEAEEAQGFENNFMPPSSLNKKQSPKSAQRYSVDPKYSEYATETIQRVQKSPGLRKKFGIDFSLRLNNDHDMSDEAKLSRKKSGGAWLKDKISTLGTGLRTSRLRTGESNNNSAVKKEVENGEVNGTVVGGRGAKDFSTLPVKPPTSPRGTPQEASERSKRKSQSLISQRSAEGTFLFCEVICVKSCTD